MECPVDRLSAPSVTVVVPIYNEENRLKDFVTVLVDFTVGLPAGSALHFVDDGSTVVPSTCLRRFSRTLLRGSPQFALNRTEARAQRSRRESLALRRTSLPSAI